MNTITKTAACAAMLLLNLPVFAEGFVRPLVEFISPETDGYSTRAGVGAVVGSQFGKQEEHELSFEAAGTQWNTARVSSVGAVALQERFVTCLLNYRYHFGPATAPVRFYAGPSLGYTNNDVSGAVTGAHGVTAGRESIWNLTWSGSAGLTFKLSEKIELDVGYRFLHVQPRDTTLAGYAFKGEAVKAHVVYAGVGFRF
jgi:opacity protein-like surface antigen